MVLEALMVVLVDSWWFRCWFSAKNEILQSVLFIDLHMRVDDVGFTDACF